MKNLTEKLIVVGFVLVMVAIGIFIYKTPVEVNTDPRNGWTDTYPTKICDGTTLIYGRSRGVVPNSPECVR